MKKYVLFLIMLFALSQSSLCQVEKYYRVKIYTPDVSDILRLAAKGLPMESGEHKPGAYIVGEFSESELTLIGETGLKYDILIDDLSAFYCKRNEPFDIDRMNMEMKASRRSFKNYTTPENFSLGSMGGYHTYTELLAELDEMKTLFPNLISTKQPIGTTNTIEGRPVYWVRISNNPEVDQEKPAVLYTALTHAREPASLQQMLYQMWYLMENYNSDPEIQYLINNLEMYFIPCVNPDGYIYNHTTNPNGGGMWRKNRRNNGDGSFGIDLNRNYGYNWGYDNSGSSPYGSSETYRGTGPFSEPETQLVKQFCEAREISLALNNHTYSDLLIYPWGYANILTPDSLVFIKYAQLLTSENHYTYGTCYETLNYVSNGSSDDWMYGEQTTKNKIFAFTPEAGKPSDGFWPAVNRIEEICAGHTGMNLYLARLALAYANVKDLSPRVFSSVNSFFPFEITSLGQANNPTFTVSIQPISSNIQSVGEPIVFNNLDVLASAVDSIGIAFKPGIANGDLVKFALAVNNGSYTYTDTIVKQYGSLELIIDDQCNNMGNWTSTSWNITSQYYHSAPTSINDSPNSNYPNNATTFITLNMAVDLTDAVMAWVDFMARWDIEKNWDYAQFMISTDNGSTWTPLQGQHTSIGGSYQDSGKPLYHGTQSNWVKEEISLGSYIGQTVKFRFRMVSDVMINGQGFFFDDFRIEKMVPSSDPSLNLPSELSFVKGDSLTIDVSEYISNFIDNLELSWEGNDKIIIEKNGWEITLRVDDEEWIGTEDVTFTISGEFGTSSSTVAIECTAPGNYVPVIVGQYDIVTHKNVPIEITLDHLIVEDEDNTYPDDFSLTVLEGDNYSCSNHTITPAENYVGMLSVPVYVSDGRDDSNTFNLSVEVRIPDDVVATDGRSSIQMLYHAELSLLTILVNPDEMFHTLQIFDMQGRMVTSRMIAGHSQRIDVSLANPTKGLYVVRLLGKRVYSERIVL
ncbi:MAG TPA: M14 family zinc carboxypeptidase [Tenuifilaceae bacterium]|jgi:hypothetical protein|nr:M14 family zinc carboxypeptidase [Bacteroidota bacterium]MZP81605.1 T9SS type A sorting domain-containing protein [Bacteroidales bacterium]OQC61158.1 MAG: Carboxypeptidase T precursor [Bacteroidetes bacterium ADurb.Bin008]HNV81494.1 M14 family zinc carboxypeptidase [Tenuifilaceae bacterium]HOF90848.1 M14 family zinc carboxypeptidase [Tenuifilaceae bacterium]